VSPRIQAAQMEPREGERRIYTVQEIAQAIDWALGDQFGFVSVVGEISGLKRVPSGHVYFDLKGENAKIKVSLFKSRVRVAHASLADGVQVQVDGKLEFYATGGSISLVAERVAPVGLGALQARFDALKRALEAEGLFRPERKRPLPLYPSRIGIVTSPSGAAVRDMLRILRHRAPYIRVIVAPCAVQGAGAAFEIAAAIALLNEWGKVDVIIAGRGGGSIEDLWAFNEEAVVRAIVGSRIPVVSAVGHETDITLADLAADVRAVTPTHAAQLVAPSREDVCATLDKIAKHARDRLRRELREAQAHLAGIRNHHALREPGRMIRDGRRRVDDLSDALGRGLGGWVQTRRRRMDHLTGVLRAHSPGRSLERSRERVDALRDRVRRSTFAQVERDRAALSGAGRLLASYDHRGVLRRGYALVWSPDRRLIMRGGSLEPGADVSVEFADAQAEAKITKVERKPGPMPEGGAS
jgi:exodeoxyribonuclease VII large subunit